MFYWALANTTLAMSSDRARIIGELVQELVYKLQEVDELVETLDIVLNEETYRGLMESIEEAKRGEVYPIEQLLKQLQEEDK